jgi:hypothetical protein
MYLRSAQAVFLFLVACLSSASLQPANTVNQQATSTTFACNSGPPLQVMVSTDKPNYMVGETITVVVLGNRPAEGRLTVSPPSGASLVFPYVLSSPSFTVASTLTASELGIWTVTFQADDYCSGISTSQTQFDVFQNGYDVQVSLSGVPPQVSLNLQIDGQGQFPINGTSAKKLTFMIGTSHTIAADQYGPTDSWQTGIRYYCKQNVWSVNSTGSHAFNYVTQYLLTVNSTGMSPPMYGNPAQIWVNGSLLQSTQGWFNTGAEVQVKAPSTVATGTGTVYQLNGWQVDGVMQSGNPVTLTMNSPHTAIAVYQVATATTPTPVTTQTNIAVTSPVQSQSVGLQTVVYVGGIILLLAVLCSAIFLARRRIHRKASV